MHGAAQQLIGLHDFTTFRSAHCQSQSPVKTLDKLTVSRHGEDIIIEAAARSFLHHQVRSMIGCLTLVGHGKWSARDLKDALDAADRNRSEEHTSELQSLMRISYAVFCLKKQKRHTYTNNDRT